MTRFADLYGGGDTNRSRLVPEAVAAPLSGRSPVIRSDGSPGGPPAVSLDEGLRRTLAWYREHPQALGLRL